jgi:FlaA1/EpsC-like NDP-sugar epimerase
VVFLCPLKILNDLNLNPDVKIIIMTILVTGAAGFIGSNFVLDWLDQSTEDVVSLDLLTLSLIHI